MKKAIMFFLGLLVFVSVNFVISEISSGASIIDCDPDNGATDVPVGTWITIRFDSPMDIDSVYVVIDPPLEPYNFRIEWSGDGRELTIKPHAELRYNQIYNISLDGAMDNSGNPLENPFINFETESEPEVIEFKGWESSTNLTLMIILIILCMLTGLWLGFVLAKRRVKPK